MDDSRRSRALSSASDSSSRMTPPTPLALPVMPPWHVQENKWRAARYGVDAIIILDADSNERLVTEDLDNLVDHLLPVAESLSCVNELTRVADIYRAGASYQRQRRVAEEHDGDLRTVVDALVGELVI